ncbi:IS3 family transposase [Legionella sp. W05-934-2]|uniref:IS3 family transposase n=1 Tax=Legionella TaxID=445 RepID=UPI00346309B2
MPGLISDRPCLDITSSIKEAQLALFDYIQVFYNRKRILSTLGFQAPNVLG